MYKGIATVENIRELPQKLKIKVPYDPVICLLGTYPKEIKKQSYLEDISTLPYSLPHFSQHPRLGDNLGFHQN